MDVLVFGANGPTGRLVVRQAIDAGWRVGAVTRKPDTYPLTSSALTVLEADVTDAAAVDQALAERPKAVVSTYGVPYGRRPISVYSEGARHLVEAMTQHGVSRLVCVTSTTVAPGEAPGESLAWRKLVVPLLRRVVGRTLYDDMERMEALVRCSPLDWTIVRPGGLFDAEEPTADRLVSTERLTGRLTSRADLAAVLLQEAVDPQHSRQTIEVITRSSLPSAGDFLRGAFGS